MCLAARSLPWSILCNPSIYLSLFGYPEGSPPKSMASTNDTGTLVKVIISKHHIFHFSKYATLPSIVGSAASPACADVGSRALIKPMIFMKSLKNMQ